MIECPSDIPGAGEQQKQMIAEVLYHTGIGRQHKLLVVKVFLIVLNPAQMLIRKHIETDITAGFVFEAIFKYFKLKLTNNAYDNLFHTGIRLVEDLDCTFLCNLGNTLDELLALERNLLANGCEQLACERRDARVRSV